MDMVAIREKARDWLMQYKFVALILAVGFFLMLMPAAPEKQTAPVEGSPEPQQTLQEQLSELLSHMKGAGKVRVLLTYETGEETLYQTDRNLRDDAQQTDTVIVTGADRAQTGLVRQVNPPEYLGAVVLCQGADNPSVKLSIVEAVSKATGITTDRITVLKMK